jgi:Negative regulator of beta-lactamase expression
MPNSLIWLPSVLQSAGLKVATVPGWEERGRDVGPTLGVLCHHTAGQRHGNMPSLQVLIDGRSDLKGPLAQLGLGRDGTYYVIAAGRCNHAGEGIWNGVTNGNTNFIGIEAENTGGANDFPWPAVQLDAYRRGVAAILKFIGQPAIACAGHKEYARPLGRKNDPVFNMDEFRAAVAAILDGTAPAPVLIPPVEPTSRSGETPRPTLRRGDTGPLVLGIQKKLGVAPAGPFGPKTEAAVRELQRRLGMVPDGIVGPKTWAAIDALG